jgi:multicomponent Na+:H+ antiporter subunit A
VALSLAGLAAVLVLWSDGGGAVAMSWAPSLDLNLSFALDGIGALYGLLATGIGAAVFTYASAYMPARLEQLERPTYEGLRFYGLLALFMVSMVGLATAQDLILLFVFWDLTAIASYFLIGFDRRSAEARVAAMMALLITGISAVLLLIGALVLYAEYGTFSIPELAELIEPGGLVTLAGALIVIAGLAKSAQVPVQFWLPRAMVAPTPVSAYLHSAAMVAAGVLLIGRTYPLIEDSRLILDGLLVVGGLSIVVGSLLAFGRDNLKQLLAYSTVSQYGYIVFLYGLGGPIAASAAAFYVLTHAIAKSALFMTAGAITAATGEKDLSRVGGLLREMPVLAVVTGISVATIAALPLTLGFFADEVFFKAAVERGTAAAAFAVAAAALTFAYLGRFWVGIFLGPRRAAPRPIARRLVAPIAVLAALALIGGVAPGPVAELAADAGEASVREPASLSVAYYLDTRAENLMALGAWLGGLTLMVGWPRLRPGLRRFARFGERFGGERAYGLSIFALNRSSDRIHDFEVRDLRTRIAAVLVPAGMLVVAGIAATPIDNLYVIDGVPDEDVGLVILLAVTAVAALSATIPRHHLTLALALAGVGFAMAGVYTMFGAPDVALVAVLVETIFALLFIGVFAMLPRRVLEREARLPTGRGRHRRDLLVGVIAGGVAFAVAWSTLSRPAPEEDVAGVFVEKAPAAHASDIVTAILADFRALDTLGEITVVAIAFAGVAALLRRGRIW